MCLGRRFAYLQLSIIWAVLTDMYFFSPFSLFFTACPQSALCGAVLKNNNKTGFYTPVYKPPLCLPLALGHLGCADRHVQALTISSCVYQMPLRPRQGLQVGRL
ncbi:hypothetical protein T492DRAFT_944232 [Pavlovales sp. CCMP2436]|nr:hypothetical protein T492DRAFT_944232 [Pavlovales sp. CCMP2436]